MKLKNFFALGLLLIAGNALAVTKVDLKINNAEVLTGRSFNDGEEVEVCTMDKFTVSVTVNEGEENANVTLNFKDENGASHTMNQSLPYNDKCEKQCSVHPEYSFSLTVAQIKSGTEASASQE